MVAEGAAAAIALDPREVLAADAKSTTPVIPKRLLRFCASRTEDRQQAKDMASEAIALTLAGEGWKRWEWDGVTDKTESLLMHLCTMARDVLKKERERASEWREVRGKETDAPDSGPTSTPGERSPESTRHAQDMRRAEAVMARLDEGTREMLRIESQSEEAPTAVQLAAKLGWTEKQVYRARERVAYHREIVLAAERKRGGPRE
jgi:hypothetical protein